jgi:hypothetical protein
VVLGSTTRYYESRTIKRIDGSQTISRDAAARSTGDAPPVSSTLTGVSNPVPTFTLAPNPASNWVEVHFENNFTDVVPATEVFVIDMLGKTVGKYSLTSGTTRLPLSLPAGLYTVRIGSVAKRLLIE